jgi:hypothetical protein
MQDAGGLTGCFEPGYENVAGVWWFGMVEGCICTGGNGIDVTERSCDVGTNSEAACETTPKDEAHVMNSLNGHSYCA